MGSTFVEFNQKGFWANDSILELWLRLLAWHLDEPSNDEVNIKLIRNQWLLASRGFFQGCVPVELDSLIKTSSDSQVIEKAIASLVESLKTSGEILDEKHINLLGFEYTWRKGVRVAGLIEMGESFQDLISGKIVTSSSNASHVPKTI